MTRELAIKVIQDFIGWFKEDSLIRKALEMAIQVLSQDPVDCANAEHDADGCLGYSTDIGGYSYCQTCEECPKASINNRDKKTGKWRKHTTDHSIYYTCSECFCVAPNTEGADGVIWRLSKYCPDCGAKMEREDTE